MAELRDEGSGAAAHAVFQLSRAVFKHPSVDVIGNKLIASHRHMSVGEVKAGRPIL
jgi:hypothetical protein